MVGVCGLRASPLAKRYRDARDWDSTIVVRGKSL